jgi:hypothetical protein
MKRYPKIPPLTDKIDLGEYFYIFDKLDGSNVRVEWRPKQGLHKFGRRKALLDDSNEFLPEAEQLILDKYGDDLGRIFKAQRWQRATAFFEFWGMNSFAGTHIDEEHDVTLLDVAVYKRGVIPPGEFLKLFGHLDHPALLHQGIIDDPEDFFEQVYDSTLPGLSFEGVVGKSGRFVRKLGMPIMFKRKTAAFIEKLRMFCKGNERLFQKLV